MGRMGLNFSDEVKKYFNNTFALFIEKILRLTIGFFVIILLTRYLGPEKFGLLSYALTYVSIAVSAAALGLDGIVTREIVKNPEAKDALLGTAFTINLASSLIVIGFVIFLVNITEDFQTALFIGILSFTILFTTFGLLVDAYFQAKVLSKYTVYSNTTAFLISSLLKIILIYIEVELIYFAYALLLDSMIIAFGYFYIYRVQNLSFLNWRFEKKIAQFFIKLALPLFFIAITAYVYTRTDQIMIKHLLGNEDVGYYAAALRVSEILFFVPGVIVASLFPKIVSLREESLQNYLRLLEGLFRGVVWFAIVVAISLSFFSNEIINILYGTEYLESARILRVLSFSIIFASISAVFVKILYAENYEKKYLFKNLLGVFVNIFLNYFLIKSYGALGAAYATLITLFIVNYVYDLLDKDLRRFYYLKLICFLPYKK
jgi:O-antigen/teichoic acid export membrane protein